ncbi:hypothetical protein [Aurantimicrobium sp.]|uniref:hypothetical protein n=1 Tax=Aurantimicrobium sp. TaxID=1930784 RepID=UPI002FC95C18
MARRMFAAKGTDSELHVDTEVEYNPSNPSPSVTTTVYPVRTIWFDFTRSGNGQKAQDGTLIEMGDKEVYLLPSTAPAPTAYGGCFLVHKGVRYAIKNVKEHNPDTSNPIYYVLTLVK